MAVRKHPNLLSASLGLGKRAARSFFAGYLWRRLCLPLNLPVLNFLRQKEKNSNSFGSFLEFRRVNLYFAARNVRVRTKQGVVINLF